jgi:RNA polymerase sigma-70 factor (ECF subfamily)
VSNDAWEASIAGRIRRGDPSAFDEFFERMAGPLLGYLTGMLGDRARAEDVLQESAIRVHGSIHRYNEAGRFRAWVFRIATNLALTELRRARYRAYDSLDCVREVADERAPDPLAAAENGERLRLLREGLRGLPDEHRAVVLLRVRRGLEIREIAEILCVPEGTVKSRLHTAVRRLRRHVAGPGGATAREEPS